MHKMIPYNTIVCGSCQDVAPQVQNVDVVLTSPFYNTSVKTLVYDKERRGRANQRGRYDTLVDVLTNDEYNKFMVDLFNKIHPGLKDTGVILFNISYSTGNSDGYMFALSEIILNTQFTLVDQIAWKKPMCIPDISSTNRLTRIVEPIYVFCKKGFEKKFHMNKEEVSQGGASHRCYKHINNFIEADISRGKCPYNKATYSVDLCEKLLKIYAPKNALVYDPFMGSGTTAVACKKMGLRYIGSEISQNQVNWANDWIAKEFANNPELT